MSDGIVRASDEIVNVNPQDPSTHLKPDEPLIGADGRDWSWAYVWFKDVKVWPGYKVEWHGAVWSCRTFQGTLGRSWRKLRPRPDKDGYLSVTLCDQGKRLTKKLAHLVLEAFVAARPEGADSCHSPDPDLSNNCAANLRWDTHRNNCQDKITMGTVARGERHGTAKLTADDVRLLRELRETAGLTYEELGRRFGVSHHQVFLIVKRRNWRHIA